MFYNFSNFLRSLHDLLFRIKTKEKTAKIASLENGDSFTALTHLDLTIIVNMLF